MEVLSSSSLSSKLNPNAPMFIPIAYRTVEDFSDQWWALIQSSSWFRDYWLQERYFDPQVEDFDDFNFADLDSIFDCDDQMEEVEEVTSKEVVAIGSLNGKKSQGFEKRKSMEKVPKFVNVKMSPRMIQQPR